MNEDKNENSFNNQTLKTYESLLESYQQELEKKNRENLKNKTYIANLMDKYNVLETKLKKIEESESKIFSESKKFKELNEIIEFQTQELLKKSRRIEELEEYSTRLSKRDNLNKIEIEKKEAFIKELLYESKKNDLEKQNLLKMNEEFQEKQSKTFENKKILKENELFKEINKIIVTLLKWKNVELELKTDLNQKSTENSELYLKVSKFKSKEQTLLQRLGTMTKELESLSDN